MQTTIVERRSGWLRPEVLAWFSLIGVVTYIGIDVLLRFLRPEYSLIHNAESDYGRGPWYWVMDVNFLLRCALSLAIVGALAQTLPSKAGTRAGIALLGLWAAGSGMLAFFADNVEGTPVTASGRVHLVLAFVAFTCVTLGTVLISASVKSAATWRSVGTELFVISMLVALAYIGLGAVLPHKRGPGGLVERIFLGLALLWIAVAAGCVVRFARRLTRP